MRIDKKKNQFLIVFLVVGFFIGIIFENVIVKKQISTTDIFLKSNLQRYLQTDVVVEKYLRYVIKERFILFGCICVVSCMKWKKVMVYLSLLLVGFFAGCFCVASVVRLGIKGLLLFMAGMFPQMLFYGCLCVMLYLHWLGVTERRWSRTKTIFVVILLTLGIIVEVYVNPIIVKFIIGIL